MSKDSTVAPKPSKPPPTLESRMSAIMRLLTGCTDSERTKIVGALASMYLDRGGTSQ
jgi:hypothetical protein